MKEVPLTRGLMAVIDAEDFYKISDYKWSASKNPYGGHYAKRGAMIDGKRKTFYMHRTIVECPSGMVVDHINGNTLDNRKENLRVCTFHQNLLNARHRMGKSGLKGVWQNCRGHRWDAMITNNKKREFLGSFDTPEEAHQAWVKRATELRGEYMCSETTGRP